MPASHCCLGIDEVVPVGQFLTTRVGTDEQTAQMVVVAEQVVAVDEQLNTGSLKRALGQVEDERLIPRRVSCIALGGCFFLFYLLAALQYCYLHRGTWHQ